MLFRQKVYLDGASGFALEDLCSEDDDALDQQTYLGLWSYSNKSRRITWNRQIGTGWVPPSPELCFRLAYATD